MPNNLAKSLERLKSNTVLVSKTEAYERSTVALDFSDGTRIQAGYWRLIKAGKERVSSFDHEQKYGLSVSVDAVEILKRELENQAVVEATVDGETGDLHFRFADDVKVQVFAFSGYEVWEIRFPDGSAEYSNHAK